MFFLIIESVFQFFDGSVKIGWKGFICGIMFAVFGMQVLN